LIGGVAAAVLLLAVLAWAILRASVKLPIGLFFSISGIVLLVLAVVFTGQGIAALQEAGKVGAQGVNFISVPMLGIYPTMQSLAAQGLVLLVCAFGMWWVARDERLSNMASSNTDIGRGAKHEPIDAVPPSSVPSVQDRLSALQPAQKFARELQTQSLPCVSTADLLGREREIMIVHSGVFYRLCVTRANKLILMK
jgi:hemin uptake protein HemP